MKKTEFYGYTYSKKPFKKYKHSCTLILTVKGGEEHSIFLYTTAPNVHEVASFVLAKKSDRVIDLKIINFSTKKEDEKRNKWLDQFLKSI